MARERTPVSFFFSWISIARLKVHLHCTFLCIVHRRHYFLVLFDVSVIDFLENMYPFLRDSIKKVYDLYVVYQRGCLLLFLKSLLLAMLIDFVFSWRFVVIVFVLLWWLSGIGLSRIGKDLRQ